jgi:hypothetical protein
VPAIDAALLKKCTAAAAGIPQEMADFLHDRIGTLLKKEPTTSLNSHSRRSILNGRFVVWTKPSAPETQQPRNRRRFP